MLSDIKRIIDEGHLGVRTYEQFVQACLQRAAEDDNETVALFVLAKLVQPFADYYFDQALSEGEAVAFRQQLLDIIDSYEAADNLGDKHAVLRKAIKKGLSS